MVSRFGAKYRVPSFQNLFYFASALEPVRKGGTMRCTITREKKGLEKSWYPEYYLHWEKEADQRVRFYNAIVINVELNVIMLK